MQGVLNEQGATAQLTRGVGHKVRADQREAGTVDKVAPTNDAEKRVKMRAKCKSNKCTEKLIYCFCMSVLWNGTSKRVKDTETSLA
ncbi:hypothetical protein BWG23_14030 [Flavobacterium oreochromis]|nr:hypothetical protein BWG23_14030 [Flavobacterium oreochromis]